MDFRQALKNILPDSVEYKLRDIKAQLKSQKEYVLQKRRFNRNYSREWSTGKIQVQSRVMFLTHQIEKGLSHQNFRYGFGLHVFETLGSVLKKFEQIDSQYLDNPVYQECMSALHEYIVRHKEVDKNISNQRQCLTSEQWIRAEQWSGTSGGSVQIKAECKKDNPSKPFIELLQNRHSLREYSNESVSEQDIKNAVALGTRAPSACNRQPARVIEIRNADTIAKLLEIQGGVNGYAAPPVLLLVTAKQSVFMAVNERNQGYVDGGLFAMTLLLALEAMGLASCPLHTMFNTQEESATRSILNIPDDEVLIMYIEVGHYPEQASTPASARLPVNNILTVVR